MDQHISNVPVTPPVIYPRPHRRFAKLLAMVFSMVALVATVVFLLQKIQRTFFEEATLQAIEIVPNTATITPKMVSHLPAPDFTLKNISGTSVHLFALRGKPVVIFFFASWNSAALDALRVFDGLYAELTAAGISVLAVDNLETADTASNLRDRAHLTLPIAIDDTGSVGESYHITTLPAFFFITSDGIVEEQFVGRLGKEEILARALRLQ